MGLVLEILLGLMILASFYVAYMSARTWPIYQVVLVVFIFLGSVAFFYLAARTLATHSAWRTAVNKSQSELDKLEKDTKDLQEGGAPDANGQPGKGIRQLKRDLARAAMDRGGVIFDAAIDGVQDGTAQLTLKSPDHGLAANTVLFAFDQNPLEAGGRYLGEFKVTTVAENSPAVTLVPNLPLTDAQSQRLAASKGPWTLYSTMPIDDIAVTSAPPQPPQAEPGQPVAAATPPAKAAPERTLRDYEYLFHENYVQRSVLADNISDLTSNIERTEAAIKSTKDEIAFRQTERTQLAADLEKFQFERQTITAYHQSLEKLLAQLREQLKATYTRNKQLAAELTAAQLKLADEINQRTASNRQAEDAQARANFTSATAQP